MVFNSLSENESTIFERVKAHVSAWKDISGEDQQIYTRLSGLSSACYKVSLKDSIIAIDPRSVLYRKKSSGLSDVE
jgi:hypothetical protein